MPKRIPPLTRPSVPPLAFGPDAALIEVRNQGTHRAKRKIADEDGADRLRFFGHHDELLVEASVAERDRSPDPDACSHAAIMFAHDTRY